MAAVPVFRQTESLTAFQITSSSDMLACLQLLGSVAYSGQIVATTTGATTTWQLEFYTAGQLGEPAPVMQVANVGDWVVYSSTTGRAMAYTPALFATIFHT